ncbi:MAG: hypothetical protein IJ850_02740 [Alistipes sp.]|uniref:hypothetical protein n=1 Tax=Alistipes sp. TaxID=1872444 RepID=UPI0023F2B8B1|nr:hypothetical protein [Alistipes sp.]MBR2217240.1 hypothetical protein [Alistipes sp.]
MKKLLCAIIALLYAATMQAQEEEKDVTKFLGIPVDGYKPAMIKKLKSKGFTRSTWDKDALEGEFNGTDVNVYIVTNNKKVWRIALINKYTTDSETEIRLRFNRLCEQFENNPKYVGPFGPFKKQRIPDDEDLSYEISVHNKCYEASYYQLPDSVTKEQLFRPTGEGEELREKLRENITIFSELDKKCVWFRISEKCDGEYRIIIYYDNKYNEADGEDL